MKFLMGTLSFVFYVVVFVLVTVVFSLGVLTAIPLATKAPQIVENFEEIKQDPAILYKDIIYPFYVDFSKSYRPGAS